MMELFTIRARKVLNLAKSEARKANDDYVGTHHILVGLLREGSGVGHFVLERNGLNATKIMQEAAKITQPGAGIELEEIPFNPRAKKLFEVAVEEAKALEHRYVGTEHILLAVLRDQESVACQILKNFGIKIEELIKETMELLGFYDRNFFVKNGTIFAVDPMGEELIGTYDEAKDEMYLSKPTAIHEVQRIVDTIRNKPWVKKNDKKGI